MTRLLIIFWFIVLALPLSAQEYVYPNKIFADEGLLEYRRYTLEEAMAYERGIESFNSFLLTGWSDEIRLTEDEDVYAAKIAASGDSIFSTYSTIWGEQLHFIRSLNGGINWEESIELGDTTNTYTYLSPEIIRHNSNLMIGFTVQDSPHGNNLCYFKSLNWGSSWGELHEIFPNLNPNLSNFSSFANAGQRINVAYNNYYYDSLYVLTSSNWGQS